MFEIWHSWPCLKHTGVRAYALCVFVYEYTSTAEVRNPLNISRAITLMLYSRLLRRLTPGRTHTVHVGQQSLQTGQEVMCVCMCAGASVCGWTSSSQPSATHRFRRYYYFHIVSSCVLVAKHCNHLPIAGFSAGYEVFITEDCFTLLSHDTTQLPLKVTESG